MRFLSLIPKGGAVLDLACGRGRHALPMADNGLNVTAVDRDELAALPRSDNSHRSGSREWRRLAAGRVSDFDGVVVTNYLHRPLFVVLAESLRPGGVLIYKTFAVGNEAFGQPRNPEFLLRDGELLKAFAGTLSVVAYEAGKSIIPPPAVVQRMAAINSSVETAFIPQPV